MASIYNQIEERIKNANIAPEGYFYQAHYRIKINDVNDIISETEMTLGYGEKDLDVIQQDLNRRC